MLKKPLILILFFVIIVSFCTICATNFLKPFLKEKFLEVIKESFGNNIEISEFDIGLLKGIISLKGLKIEDTKLIKYNNKLTADEIIIDIDLLATVFKKSLIFQKIYLENLSFNLRNKGINASQVKAIFPTGGDSETKIALSRVKKPLIDTLYVKRLLIRDSKFSFTDYTAIPSPAVIEIVNINGRFEDFSASIPDGGILNGTIHLNGQLNTEDEGLLELHGSFAKSERGIDFDFKANLNNVNLIRFLPYFSTTSFAILKEAKLDLDSEARCVRNRINASQDARIYDIRLFGITPSEQDTLFGLPAKTVIDFFNDLKGDIRFSFNIVGTIDDPKFDPGPLIKQVLSNAMRDRVISKLQQLPREVVEMGEKALNENLNIGERLKILNDDAIKEKIKGITEELKKIIDYKP